MSKSTAIMVVSIVSIVSFFAGVSTGHYKHQPFGFFKDQRERYRERYRYEMNFLTKIFDSRIPYHREVFPEGDVGIFVTYGQSNAGNFGELRELSSDKVFEFFSKEIYLYQDPSLGGGANGGSVWGLVGRKLIQNETFSSVIFSNNAVGGRSISELKSGPYLRYLVKNYNDLISKFGRVDAILIHQGESDNSSYGVSNYYSNFTEFVNNLTNHGIDVPIYLSQASYCGSERPVNKSLTDIQRQLALDHEKIFLGPNTDMLTNQEYRLVDKCHFSAIGNEKFAQMWVEVLQQ